MREEVHKLKITDEEGLDEKQIKERIFEIKFLAGSKQERSNGKCTEERKAIQSDRMRQIWKRREADIRVERM